jgi:hypothetical protein
MRIFDSLDDDDDVKQLYLIIEQQECLFLWVVVSGRPDSVCEHPQPQNNSRPDVVQSLRILYNGTLEF